MISLPRPDNRLYLGRGGSGKSTLAQQHAAAFPRVLLLLPDDSEAAPAGYVETSDREALVRAMMLPRWHIAFKVYLDQATWDWGNEAAFKAGNCVVIWEEAHAFMNGRKLLEATPFAFHLWMRGRHRRCHVFACSMRPASVSRDCTSNLSRACIFNTTEPNDLKFYRSMIFDPAAAMAIPRLDFERHEALDWTPSGWAVKAAPFP